MQDDELDWRDTLTYEERFNLFQNVYDVYCWKFDDTIEKSMAAQNVAIIFAKLFDQATSIREFHSLVKENLELWTNKDDVFHFLKKPSVGGHAINIKRKRQETPSNDMQNTNDSIWKMKKMKF